ncbi:MAG: hypothetical protein ACRD08_10120 [Acidimicrobiales bacterium]
MAEVIDGSGNSALARVDLDSREMEIVSGRLTGSFSASGDGRWIACLCERPGFTDVAWIVFPLDRPDLAVPARVPSAPESIELRWVNPTSPVGYLDRLEILAPATPVPRDATHRLLARGFDAAGEPAAVPVLSWRSGDTSIAVIDAATGEIQPRNLGTVVIHASAGGWRKDSARVVIGPPGSRTVLSEDWRKGLEPEWIPFGDPFPAVTAAPTGRPAFWNRGDDYFNSGAYSRQGFRAARGLGLEAELFSARSAPRAQDWSVSLTSWDDPSAVAMWDHRTGGPPGTVKECLVRYPRTDGARAMHQLALATRLAGRTVEVDPMVSSGKPYRVRLQVFPDGRCGFALNGAALWRGGAPLPLDVPYRVVLQGKSVGTRMLAGHVEVWEGVRADVDWDALDRASRDSTSS